MEEFTHDDRFPFVSENIVIWNPDSLTPSINPLSVSCFLPVQRLIPPPYRCRVLDSPFLFIATILSFLVSSYYVTFLLTTFY